MFRFFLCEMKHESIKYVNIILALNRTKMLNRVVLIDRPIIEKKHRHSYNVLIFG